MSLGRDLATIRKEKNLTLEDIFSATKIAVHTLQSIENDTLFNQSSENKTYLRSFVRSYARALKIPDEYILAALEKHDAGTYEHDLLDMLNPRPKSESYSVHKDTVSVEEDTEPDTPASSKGESASAKEDSDDSPAAAPAGQKETPDATKARSTQQAPTVATVDWANMSKKVYTSPANSKAWVIFLIILVIAGAGGAGYYFADDMRAFFGSQEEPSQTAGGDDLISGFDNEVQAPDNGTETGTDNRQTETDTTPNETTPAVSSLGDTLSIVVYAAFDKLEPVRVTSDLNWRTNPFWMDRGEAYYFDFRDTILVRGQYSRMLLMFNGHIINNPRQNNFDPEYDSILLTRQDLNRPEYLEPAPEQFPLSVGEPDSIVYRIRF